jgi:hypothetical protein
VKPRNSSLLPLRATTRGPAALRVVAFREDDRQSQLKRGARDAKGQARNVANQGKQQLQRGKNNLNRREWLCYSYYQPMLQLQPATGVHRFIFKKPCSRPMRVLQVLHSLNGQIQHVHWPLTKWLWHNPC